jgi:hypothetical protein
MIILPANTLSGEFSVANSCRFNKADSARMVKTPGGAGNVDRWTFSCWIKRGIISDATHTIFCGLDGSDTHCVRFNSNDKLDCHHYNSSGYQSRLETNRVFRDCSAWYNIIYVYDSGNGTANDRQKIYINGVEETSFANRVNADSGEDGIVSVASKPLYVGDKGDGGEYFDGYMAEVCLVDGQALTPTSFGEFDEDSPTIWKPKDVSGLTFGTNGFYLDFEDSSNLGNDKSGGTDLTESNLTAADQAQDSPSNNFCVMNILDNKYYDSDFSQGNTVIYTNGGAVYTFNTATFFLSAGRWYWEVKVAAGTNGTGTSYICGISDDVSNATSEELGNEGTQWGYYGAGHIRHNNGNDGSYSTYTAGDIVGVYLDLEDNKLYFTKNGTLENSGTGVSITAVTNSAIRNGGYFPASGYFDGDASGNAAYFYHNFGNGEFNGSAVSSSNADDNGYGLFEYSPNITGDGSAKKFYALCTKNLAEFG